MVPFKKQAAPEAREESDDAAGRYTRPQGAYGGHVVQMMAHPVA